MQRQPSATIKHFLAGHDPHLGSEVDVKHRVRHILLSARLVWPMTLLFSALLLSLLTTVWMAIDVTHEKNLWPLLLFLMSVSFVALLLSAYRLRTQLLKPLARLEESVAHVCQGEPDAIAESDNVGVFDGIVRDLGSINEELTGLYEDMDSRVARHTTRLAQKTASLKILYDVAAMINQASDLDDLLLRFLRVLKEMVNGKAATVRLLTETGQLRLVGSIGLEDIVLSEHDLLPVQLCLCGTALSPGDILCEKNPEHCSRINGRKMFGNDEIEVVSVPLEYHGETLGHYSIFVDKAGVTEREDIMDLLSTIGSHLGMAVAKQRSDADAHLLSIIEERTMLAHELHDSLAQTLASLRFQVRMMDDTLKQENASSAAIKDLERLQNGLDEAHTELRELLYNFRAAPEQRGLLQALERLVERFSQETGIHTLFQQDCKQVNLSASEEMQIQRIVQESLANIRKHAQAQTVRVLIACLQNDVYSVLVEDDGVGFACEDREGQPGEHIGLSIMEERAHRLGAELRIESEPGEGTRVELVYQTMNKNRMSTSEGNRHARHTD